jgi:hypothetical protein
LVYVEWLPRATHLAFNPGLVWWFSTGGTLEPPTETVVYSRIYPGWETGIMMAMEEALARIYGMYV